MSAIELATSVARGDAESVARILAESSEPAVLLAAKVGLNGATLLHMAASHGYPDVVEALIDGGADPNVLDANRKAPIAYVTEAEGDAAETREALISHGAIEDPEYFLSAQPKSNDEQQADYIDKQFLRNVFIVFLLPFVVLLLYNGPLFCLVFIAGTVAFYFVGTGYFVSSITIRPPWYHPNPGEKELGMMRLPDEWKSWVHNPKKNLGIDYENVEFPSKASGYTLRGWFVPGQETEGVTPPSMGLVFLHGGGRDRRTWLRHLPMFHKQGYSCLLFDFSEHGTSDGAKRGLSFGMRERYDALAAAEFMRVQRGFKYVAVIGTSMGGSTAIMAAAMDPKSFDLVVAENPLLTCAHLQNEHIMNILGGYFKHSIFGRTTYEIFRRMCSTWLNLRVGNQPSRKCQALHVVSKIAPRPLLLMHGTYDSVIPAAHSQRLFDLAKGPKELWMAPGGFHVGLYDAFPKEFEERVLQFLRRHAPDAPKMPPRSKSGKISAHGSIPQSPSAASAPAPVIAAAVVS